MSDRAPDPVFTSCVPVFDEKAQRRAERLDIAKHVLAGLVSDYQTYQRYQFRELVNESVLFADALIAAVDKETPDA